MPDITVSADVHSFMQAANAAAARTVLSAASLAGNTFTGQQIISLNGAASTPPLTLTGTWFSGGSATTTKPQLLIEPSGTTSTNWSTSGTGLGINSPSGFSGNVIDAQVNGTELLRLTSTGNLGVFHSSNNGTHTYIGRNGLAVRVAGTGMIGCLSPDTIGLWLSSGTPFGFSSNAGLDSGFAPDVTLSRAAASILKIGGVNGGGIKILQATTTLSGVTGASVTATNLVPARAQVIGVATRVTTGLGTGSGTTGYTVGDGSDADRFGAVTGTIAGTDTDSSTDATADPRMTWSASAQNIVITAAGGNFDGTGAIRVEVYYLGDTAPTS